MAATHQKLADALTALRALQKHGRNVFQSGEFTRLQRERLVRQGFLREVVKGWLIAVSPEETEGESTPWYAVFWEFCAHYCETKFSDQWHLSPEQSLLLHAENTAIPRQVIVYTANGGNNTLALPLGTTLYDLKQSKLPASEDLEQKHGVRVFRLESALLKIPDAFFTRYPVEAQVVLLAVKDATEILRRLLNGGHSSIAGRLAGAFRRVGKKDIADEIAKTMHSAGYPIREFDPFAKKQSFGSLTPSLPPIVGRLRVLWSTLREPVMEIFPKAPGKPRSVKKYLHTIDESYQRDAYNSLSIEGYHVTPELIERVQSGKWNRANTKDRADGDALAARGYWQAFQHVKETIENVMAGAHAGKLTAKAHKQWYRELFQPCVAAGLIPASALAGYRNHAVFLRGSRHVPPRSEIVAEAMSEFFDLLENEKEASVRAVLGSWLFGYIHPYPDGNGRISRFLMNVMLASGGYPWTIVPLKERSAYLAALEAASVEGNIKPFTRFIAKQMEQKTSPTRTSGSKRTKKKASTPSKTR